MHWFMHADNNSEDKLQEIELQDKQTQSKLQMSAS